MDNIYGIGTDNRYSILCNDESDPLEKLKIKNEEKELKKKLKIAEKENKATPDAPPKGKTIQSTRKPNKDITQKVQENKREDGKPNQQRNNENKPEKTFNKINNENREERNNRRNREDRPFNGGSFENRGDREDRPRRDVGDFDRRGRPAGNKVANRGGQRRFDDRRGKREFDRQSGSDKTHGYRGVKPIDKREGGGAHNWGSHKDIIEEADQSKVDNEPTWNENKEAEPANTSGEIKEPETEPEVPVEEEPKELTLDEWKAQRAGRQKPTYNLRKAGEGEDPAQWKKMYELNKKKLDEEESEDEEFDAADYPQRVGRQKHVVGIDFHFNDARRGGGRGRGARTGRGGRGNRGGGGGGDRGDHRDHRDHRGDRGDRRDHGERGERGERGGAGAGSGEHREPKGNNRYRGEEQREDKSDSRTPKVDDERDFPSLG